MFEVVSGNNAVPTWRAMLAPTHIVPWWVYQWYSWDHEWINQCLTTTDNNINTVLSLGHCWLVYIYHPPHHSSEGILFLPRPAMGARFLSPLPLSLSLLLICKQWLPPYKKNKFILVHQTYCDKPPIVLLWIISTSII